MFLSHYLNQRLHWFVGMSKAMGALLGSHPHAMRLIPIVCFPQPLKRDVVRGNLW